MRRQMVSEYYHMGRLVRIHRDQIFWLLFQFLMFIVRAVGLIFSYLFTKFNQQINTFYKNDCQSYYYKMLRKPELEVKDLIEKNNQQYTNYKRNIVYYQTPFTVWTSLSQKYGIINKDCLFVMFKAGQNQMRIGYVQNIYQSHPLIRRKEDIQRQIHLQDIVNVCPIDQIKLSITYVKKGEKIKELVFVFPHKTMVDKWLNIIFSQKANLNKPINLATSKIQQFKATQQKLHSEIQSKEQAYENLQILYEDLKQVCRQSDQKIVLLKRQNKDMKNNIEQLQNQRQIMLAKMQQLESQKRDKEKQLLKAIQVKQVRAQEELRRFKQQVQSLNYKLINEQNKNKSMLKRHEQMIEENKKVINTFKQSNQTLMQELNSLRLFCQNQKSSKYSQKQELKKIILQQNKVFEQLSIKLKDANAQIQSIQRRQSILKVELKQKISQISKKQQESAFLRLKGLFAGNALEDYHHHKLYLKQKLQTFRQMKILRTRLLYKFDRLSKVNFHNYIDNEPDIVLVVKTAEGAFLAGYSQSPISQHVSADRPGMIISLTNQSVFHMHQDKKAVTYDDYYIIFGNSEIRLKSLELSIFSNFGIANGFFNNNGLGVEALFCNENREVGIETYEVHRVYFDL